MKHKLEVPGALVNAIADMIEDPELIYAADAEALKESVREKLDKVFGNPAFLMTMGRFVAAKKKEVAAIPAESETFENTALYGIEDLKNLPEGHEDIGLKKFVESRIEVLRSDLESAKNASTATQILKRLSSQGIMTVSDLLAYSRNELVSLIRNFGPTHMNAIVQVLAQKKLRMKR